jgi:hypothetical protein
VYLDSLNPDQDTGPDPAFQVNSDTDTDLDDQKLQKNTAGILFFFSSKKGFHKGRPNYRRSFQPSIENNQHFKR